MSHDPLPSLLLSTLKEPSLQGPNQRTMAHVPANASWHKKGHPLQEQQKPNIHHSFTWGKMTEENKYCLCAKVGTHFLTSIDPHHRKGCSERRQTPSIYSQWLLSIHCDGHVLGRTPRKDRRQHFCPHGFHNLPTPWCIRVADRKKRSTEAIYF